MKSNRDIYLARKIVSVRGMTIPSDVFDLKKGYANGLTKHACKKESPCPPLVFLYACMGIHRYNLLKGTKFEVIRVKRYVNTNSSAAAKSYFITLVAKEPQAASPKTTTFQTRVSETSLGKFLLSCTIARIQGDTGDDIETTSIYIPDRGTYLKHVPEWPQENNPFEKSYLVKKESELEDKDKDWINLYLQLAVATSDMEWFRKRNPKEFVDDLKIVEVATHEGINAKSATLYIRYQDMYRALLGQNRDVDRVAIVRRRFDEVSGYFSLEGLILSLEQVIIPKMPKIVANEEDDTGCSILKGQNKRSETIEFCPLHADNN